MATPICSINISNTNICSICIICREPVNSISGIYPCCCKYARHRSCLYNWLKLSPRHYKTKCEVCLQPYSTDGPNSILNYNDSDINNYINDPYIDITLPQNSFINNDHMHRIDIFGCYELSKLKRTIVTFFIILMTGLGYYIYYNLPKNVFTAICFMVSIIISECVGFVFLYKLFIYCRCCRYGRTGRTPARVIPVEC